MAAFGKVSRVFVRQYSSHLPWEPVPDAEKTAKLWKKLFFFAGIPAIALGMLNGYLHAQEEHAHERPPFVPYEYMRIRTKRYPWGDGQRTAFHNPKVNPLPGGYEDEI